MENNNLLNLNDDDVLNIIGKYVEKDNYNRIKREEDKQWRFKYADQMVKSYKRNYGIKDRPSIWKYIYQFFPDWGFQKDEEVINEYVTLKKLNLKRK